MRFLGQSLTDRFRGFAIKGVIIRFASLSHLLILFSRLFYANIGLSLHMQGGGSGKNRLHRKLYRGTEMFLHFDSDPDGICDNCENTTTIAHMSVKRWERSMNLCIPCFMALAKAISQASQKLARS